jgi:hypothetical protein
VRRHWYDWQISSLVARAPIAGMIGLAGESNASGDEQKKLDLIANEVFTSCLSDCGRTGTIVSEEFDTPIAVESCSLGTPRKRCMKARVGPLDAGCVHVQLGSVCRPLTHATTSPSAASLRPRLPSSFRATLFVELRARRTLTSVLEKQSPLVGHLQRVG